jgi:hypothetical protein
VRKMDFLDVSFFFFSLECFVALLRPVFQYRFVLMSFSVNISERGSTPMNRIAPFYLLLCAQIDRHMQLART